MLACNEAPFGLLPGVHDAVERALRNANRYPDPSNMRLRRALAARFDFAPERIAIGSGSCDILLSAAEALLEPGAEIVYAWPSFSRLSAHGGGDRRARDQSRRSNAEHAHDLDAMLAEITVATRLVIVCNPNNPTSTALPLAEIERFVEAVPRNVCVLIDEAYCEFNVLDDPDASLDLVRAPRERRPAAHLLEGLRARRPALRLRAVRRRALPRRGRAGAPAVLLQRARAGGRRGGAAGIRTR